MTRRQTCKDHEGYKGHKKAEIIPRELDHCQVVKDQQAELETGDEIRLINTVFR